MRAPLLISRGVPVIRWTYSQKNTGSLSPYATQANFPELTDNGPDINSTEIYGAVTLPGVPLSPNLTLYYDADIYKGMVRLGIGDSSGTARQE
ncbi:MAG TPA: hypothetical protein VGR09_16000 [Gemmatimonadales bacterium]|nr:hypothetical protein [Gemmatimonadales bacterium]